MNSHPLPFSDNCSLIWYDHLGLLFGELACLHPCQILALTFCYEELGMYTRRITKCRVKGGTGSKYIHIFGSVEVDWTSISRSPSVDGFAACSVSYLLRTCALVTTGLKPTTALSLQPSGLLSTYLRVCLRPAREAQSHFCSERQRLEDLRARLQMHRIACALSSFWSC